MKRRIDFVSNSSSCSFVVSSKLDRVPFLEKLFNRTSIQPGWDRDGCCKNDIWFKDYTALVVSGLDFWNEDCDRVICIRGGHCIHNNELSRYFDENGKIKKDLDFFKVAEDICWHDDCDSTVGQNNCSLVTEKTIQFSEWLLQQAQEKSMLADDYDCEHEFPETLQKVKDALSKGLNVYYCFASYEGDAQIGGYFYVDFDEKYKCVKDNFTAAVDEFLHWDS